MQSISSLFFDHNGKCSDKWENYLEVYESEFKKFRCKSEPVSLLEIGVQDGGSLEIWHKALPPGSTVTGLDIDPRVSQLTFGPKIDLLIGDASNSSALAELLQDRVFDIIIDDASHYSKDVVTTFETLFSRLRPGGVYIIEDLACSYQAAFGGGLRRPEAAIEWLKRLVDVLHIDIWNMAEADAQDLHLRDTFGPHVERLTFYESIAVVAKRAIPKLQPNRRLLTGRVASHSTHIAMLANEFPVDPNHFRLTEAFAREVILEIARQRDARPLPAQSTMPDFAGEAEAKPAADISIMPETEDSAS